MSDEWVMVPRTPTVAMLKAAGKCFVRMKTHHGGATGADYYRAMLASAPAPLEEPKAVLAERLTRPIIGIENRAAQEVFDIMADRVRRALAGEKP